jgi:riboflavin-specific deaminase-like protein
MSLNHQIERWISAGISQFDSQSRPFVTLAYAQSLDGSITSEQGEALALSGPESTRLTHQLRSLHNGILVGIETVLSDDPQLTVRMWEGDNPQPVVLDSLLRMPASAKLCNHPDKDCWVLTSCEPSSQASDKLIVLPISNDKERRVPLDQALQLLKSRGIDSLMVEGGATIITAFLEAKLVDAIVMTVAPAIVGGYKAVNNLDTGSSGQIPLIDPLYSEKLGKDIIIWGDVHFDGDGSASGKII